MKNKKEPVEMSRSSIQGVLAILAVPLAYAGWKVWQLLTMGYITTRQAPMYWPEHAVGIVVLISLFVGFPMVISLLGFREIRRGKIVVRK